MKRNKIEDNSQKTVKPGGEMPKYKGPTYPQPKQPTKTQFAMPPSIQSTAEGQSSSAPSTLIPPQQSKVKPLRKGIPNIAILAGVFLALIAVFIFIVTKVGPPGFSLIGEKGEIVWWGFWSESAVLPLIDEYLEENPNVEITYISQSSRDYRERLTNSLARGDGPDIFGFHNSWVPMFKNELDSLPANEMNSKEFSTTYYRVILSDLNTAEGIVGIPLGYDALTLYINEDIFAAAGKAPPVTWDEFQSTAKELTARSDKIIIQSGAAIGRTENVDHWQEILALMMLQNGVDMANPQGQLANDAVNFFTSFAGEDGVWDEILPPSTVAFANGKTAMYFGPAWRADEINKMNPNLRFKTALLPQLRKDDPAEPDVSYATYWVEGVWKRSANKKEAWEFLKFLSAKESLERLYDNQSLTSLGGEPYPRVDMSGLLKDDKVAGSVLALAPSAKSWYLADATNDGPTGINSQLAEVYKVAIDNVVAGRLASRELETVAAEVRKILSQFGIRAR